MLLTYVSVSASGTQKKVPDLSELIDTICLADRKLETLLIRFEVLVFIFPMRQRCAM